jgi:hypothetical protein
MTLECMERSKRGQENEKLFAGPGKELNRR